MRNINFRNSYVNKMQHLNMFLLTQGFTPLYFFPSAATLSFQIVSLKKYQRAKQTNKQW